MNMSMLFFAILVTLIVIAIGMYFIVQEQRLNREIQQIYLELQKKRFSSMDELTNLQLEWHKRENLSAATLIRLISNSKQSGTIPMLLGALFNIWQKQEGKDVETTKNKCSLLVKAAYEWHQNELTFENIEEKDIVQILVTLLEDSGYLNADGLNGARNDTMIKLKDLAYAIIDEMNKDKLSHPIEGDLSDERRFGIYPEDNHSIGLLGE